MYSDKLESNVKSYCRDFPVVFAKSKMSKMYDVEGNTYLDFFCGAGALNYGHNNQYIIDKVVEYIKGDGIIHALDMYAMAKEEFMHTFEEKILKPQNMDYRIMFCAPTGSNANEAANKIVRKYTKRNNIFSLMGAFHGMTRGSLSLSGSINVKQNIGSLDNNVTFIPYPKQRYGVDIIDYMETVLEDDHSGVEKPAAIFVECVQAEGGIYVLDKDTLIRLRKLCDKHGILLVCDEVQVGCGRTGNFFSFSESGIKPDIITLSKSIGGCGFPMSIVLVNPEIDCLNPGEHNGTFRGNQLAFVAAKAGIEYALDNSVYENVRQRESIIKDFIEKEIIKIDERIEYRGKGFIYGIDFEKVGDNISKKIVSKCFENKLIIETAGRKSSVVKIMPALTITEDELLEGLRILKKSIEFALGQE